MYKRPHLQPYKGKSTRHTCPACKTKQSFTLYLDGNTGQPIHSTVGKCNREIKCKYHYTPRQFFHDHPELKNNHSISQPYHQQSIQVEPTNSIPVSNIMPEYGSSFPGDALQKEHLSPNSTNDIVSTIPELFDHIPYDLVEKSVSFNSNFVNILCNYFPMEKIEKAVDKYALGATKNREVIFWQIDTNGMVRTGKIMQYNLRTGGRVKNQSGAISWVHSKLKKSDPSYAEFRLCQSFFGEHLLLSYPRKTIGVVEGEKTAVIASICVPGMVWIAAGNVQGLNIEKCKVLKGRNVILYPDADAFNLWKKKADEIRQRYNCNICVSDLINGITTLKEKADGKDIADYILAQIKSSHIDTKQYPRQ